MSETRRVGRPALDDALLRSRKKRILDKTLELVAERGAAHVRLRDVAARADVSVGTLQHYFESRDQLIREAFTQHAYGVVERLLRARSASSSPWQTLQEMFDNVFEAPDLRARCLLWVEFVGASRLDEQMRELAAQVWAAWRGPIRATVERGIADGSFAPVVDIDSVVTTLLALIDGGEIAVALQVEEVRDRGIATELKAAARALLGVTEAALHQAEDGQAARA